MPEQWTASRDRDWLVPMFAIAVVQFLIWWLMWLNGLAAPPLTAEYNSIAVILLGVVGVLILLRKLFYLYREGETRPIARMSHFLRAGAPRSAAVVTVALLVPLTSSAFGAVKSALPDAVPFYLDHALADFERAVFGTDPWRISHALFGWATPVIDAIYLTWIPVMLIAFYAILLSRPSPLKSRALVVYALLWPVLGTMVAYMMSSAGPIFYDRVFGGSQFADLAIVLRDATGTQLAADNLWSAYTADSLSIGSGISAMPSLHVAGAFWIVLITRAAGSRLAWFSWPYFGLIWLGSVHLGWHYVLDGLVGVLGVLLIWKMAPTLIGKRELSRASHELGTRRTTSVSVASLQNDLDEKLPA